MRFENQGFKASLLRVNYHKSHNYGCDGMSNVSLWSVKRYVFCARYLGVVPPCLQTGHVYVPLLRFPFSPNQDFRPHSPASPYKPLFRNLICSGSLIFRRGILFCKCWKMDIIPLYFPKAFYLTVLRFVAINLWTPTWGTYFISIFNVLVFYLNSSL